MLSRVCLVLFLLMSVVTHADTLRVGLSPDYPPLQFKEGGNLMGIEVDNAHAVSKILGKRVKFVELPLQELFGALEKGEIDVIMSGLSVTAEREQQVAFVEPYMKVGQMAIMHISRAGRFASQWAMFQPGVRVGVEPDTTGAQFAAENLTDADVAFYADAEQAFAALRSGDIDLYIHDAPTSWRLATGKGEDDLISQYRELTDERLAWAVRPGDIKLESELRSALRQMKRNGTLDYILNRWIPVRVEVN